MSGLFYNNIKRNKEFEKICRMSQKALKAYLVKELNMIEGDGYAYREGTFPVLLTAHLDTVHAHLPNKIQYYKVKQNKVAVTSPNGIGGDDRCGVYMILKILKSVDCSILFCEDEETGSQGAKKFVKTDLCESLKGKFKYIIELDRMNADDAVYYDDDNKEFHSFIQQEYWHHNWGTWSDICTLSPVLEISSVNLSCGYYNQHTKSEYVVLEEMERNIEEVVKLLERTDKEAEPFKFVERAKNYNYGYYGGKYYGARSSWYDDDDDYYWGYSQYYKTKNAMASSTDNEKETVDTAMDIVKEAIRRGYPNNYVSGVDDDEEEGYGKLSTFPKQDVYLEVWVNDSHKYGSEYLFATGETRDECWKNLFFENEALCKADIIDYYFY